MSHFRIVAFAGFARICAEHHNGSACETFGERSANTLLIERLYLRRVSWEWAVGATLNGCCSLSRLYERHSRTRTASLSNAQPTAHTCCLPTGFGRACTFEAEERQSVIQGVEHAPEVAELKDLAAVFTSLGNEAFYIDRKREGAENFGHRGGRRIFSYSTPVPNKGHHYIKIGLAHCWVLGVKALCAKTAPRRCWHRNSATSYFLGACCRLGILFPKRVDAYVRHCCW